MSGLGRHAVDTPVRLAVVITDGDGESPVVCPDDLNVLVLLLTFYQQLLTLAGVASSDGRAGELAWKKRKKLKPPRKSVTNLRPKIITPRENPR